MKRAPGKHWISQMQVHFIIFFFNTKLAELHLTGHFLLFLLHQTRENSVGQDSIFKSLAMPKTALFFLSYMLYCHTAHAI